MTTLIYKILLVVILLLFPYLSYSQSGVDSHTCLSRHIDSLIRIKIKERNFPGAQIIAIKNGETILHKNYGYTDYSYLTPVTDTTIYDLASLTKCMATTLAIMKLYEQGRIDLDAPLKHYLSKYDTLLFGHLPLTRFLTHTSGFTPTLSIQYELVTANGEDADTSNWFKGILGYKKSESYPLYYSSSGRDRLYLYKDIKHNNYVSNRRDSACCVMISDSLFLDPIFYKQVDSLVIKSHKYNNNRTSYSDTNFYILREVIEKITGEKIDKFVEKEIYAPLGLCRTTYLPMQAGIDRKYIAPTEFDYILRRELIWGYAHDEFAAIMGGVEGNAGLFSNVSDLIVICNELMSDKDGFFKCTTKQKFITQPYLKEKNYRALGFQRQQKGTYMTESSFGHSGFTGTFFQIDIPTQTMLIFLSNKVNPSRSYIAPGQLGVYYEIWRDLMK